MVLEPPLEITVHPAPDAHEPRTQPSLRGRADERRAGAGEVPLEPSFGRAPGPPEVMPCVLEAAAEADQVHLAQNMLPTTHSTPGSES